MNLRATCGNLAWLAASAAAHRRFVHALENPAATQERWLRTHLRRHGATAYGEAHGGTEIRSYEEFARRIPVVSYDDLAPWLARIQRGETGVLTADPVTRLLPTSGTSTARKLIPYTAGLQAEFNAAMGPWLWDLWRNHRAIALGPAYWAVTPSIAPEAESSAVPIGFDDDSQYLGSARARLIAAAMAVPPSVRQIRDLAAFRRTVLRHLLECPDLRLVSVWHPSFLALLLASLVQDWDALLASLPGGRARQLASADPRRPETIWPRLEVVSCWADASAAGSAAELRRLFPHATVQAKGLLATEAFVSLPFAGCHPLAIRSHFFEFLDEEGQVHLAGDLRAGEIYEVIVTTAGGLWRYRLGDKVEVTGFVAHTPAIRFLGRAGIVSDLCGEKLSDAFVARTLSALCPEARFSLLAAETEEFPPRYALYLEAPFSPTLLPRLEAALRANPHYALCQDLGQLGPVDIRWITHRGHATYVEAELARGMRLGEIKPVALSTRTNWSQRFASLMSVHRPAAQRVGPTPMDVAS